MQNAGMRAKALDVSTITIRNVPPELRGALKAKAKRSGRSLQQVALEALVEKAERETHDEWLAEVDALAHEHGIAIDRDEIIQTVREMRVDVHD